MLVWPPGISDGAFQLRIDNIWFCKLLILFSIDMKTYAGIKTHEYAYVSVLEEYNSPRRPGHLLHILYILHILHILHILNLCLIVAQLGWMRASPPSYMSAVNLHKSCT